MCKTANGLPKCPRHSVFPQALNESSYRSMYLPAFAVISVVDFGDSGK